MDGRGERRWLGERGESSERIIYDAEMPDAVLRTTRVTVDKEVVDAGSVDTERVEWGGDGDGRISSRMTPRGSISRSRALSLSR